MEIIDVRSDFAEKKCTSFSQVGDALAMRLSEIVRGVLAILIELFGVDLHTALRTDAFRLPINETGECQLPTCDQREMC